MSVFFQSKQQFRAEAAASEVQQGASLQRRVMEIPWDVQKNRHKCASRVQPALPRLACFNTTAAVSVTAALR